MAILKKKPADEFVVPSLAESSPEYAGMVAKRNELHNKYNELNRERENLRQEIEQAKAAGGERLSHAVASLLGDDTSNSIVTLTERLRHVVTEMANIESAQEILRRRIDEARNAASEVVCGAVLPEYRRRLAALCDAARALESARQDHDALLDDIEREDVNFAYLRPARPFFMGDRREGRVFHFLKEVKESGHNV